MKKFKKIIMFAVVVMAFLFMPVFAYAAEVGDTVIFYDDYYYSESYPVIFEDKYVYKGELKEGTTEFSVAPDSSTKSFVFKFIPDKSGFYKINQGFWAEKILEDGNLRGRKSQLVLGNPEFSEAFDDGGFVGFASELEASNEEYYLVVYCDSDKIIINIEFLGEISDVEYSVEKAPQVLIDYDVSCNGIGSNYAYSFNQRPVITFSNGNKRFCGYQIFNVTSETELKPGRNTVVFDEFGFRKEITFVAVEINDYIKEVKLPESVLSAEVIEYYDHVERDKEITLDGTVLTFANGETVTVNNSEDVQYNNDDGSRFVYASFIAPNGLEYNIRLYFEYPNDDNGRFSGYIYQVGIGKENYNFECNYKKASLLKNVELLNKNLKENFYINRDYLEHCITSVFYGHKKPSEVIKILSNYLNEFDEYASEEISQFIKYYSENIFPIS